MEVFLEEHPEWIGKVVLVQVAVPSRQDVEEYQNLRLSVNELVGRINGRFGTVEFMPIHFMHRSIPFEELTALYRVSDAALITSTRDGMNLVSTQLSTVSFLCRLLMMPCRLGRVRVHRLSKRQSRCLDLVRICGSGAFAERVPDRQPVEHGRDSKRHQSRVDHGSCHSSRLPLQIVPLRQQVHGSALGMSTASRMLKLSGF